MYREPQTYWICACDLIKQKRLGLGKNVMLWLLHPRFGRNRRWRPEVKNTLFSRHECGLRCPEVPLNAWDRIHKDFYLKVRSTKTYFYLWKQWTPKLEVTLCCYGWHHFIRTHLEAVTMVIGCWVTGQPIDKSFRLRNAWSQNKEVAYKPMTKPMKSFWIKKCIYEEN